MRHGKTGFQIKYKRLSYGHRQPEEALRRIKEYEGLKRIIICTTVILPHQRIISRPDFACMTENRMKRKVHLRVIFCIMRLCFEHIDWWN